MEIIVYTFMIFYGFVLAWAKRKIATTPDAVFPEQKKVFLATTPSE
jgi:hypothetical protein